MKIAFASEEDKGLESMMAHHFGRCPYYVIFEGKQNPFYSSHEPGQVPQFIAEEKSNVIIAGGMGPKAIDWFERLGVQPVTGVSGKIKDVLDEYLSGKLLSAEPCDEHDG